MQQAWILSYVGQVVQHSTHSLQPHAVLPELMSYPASYTAGAMHAVQNAHTCRTQLHRMLYGPILSIPSLMH